MQQFAKNFDEMLARTDAVHPDSLRTAAARMRERLRQPDVLAHLGEGTFDEYPPPMVDTESKNYLKISLEELAAGKINYRYRP